MASLKDDRGFNQMFIPSKALAIRTRRRCDFMISEMNLSGDSSVLEIGCGTGGTAFYLAQKTGARILGADICKPFIDEAKKSYNLPNLDFEAVDVVDPGSFSGKKFDYVVGNGILHHVYFNLGDVLEKIRSLLNSRGKIIFLEPNIYNPYCFLIFSFPAFRKMANLEPGEMAFSGKFITKELIKAGFSDIHVRFRDFLLPNTPGVLINPLIITGDVLEKIPVLNLASQSIFITAVK